MSFPTPMPVLYKYLRRSHAELLLKSGKLRIGTLYEYRNIEKHGAVIGDHEEGKSSVYMGIEDEIWTPENQPDFAKSFFNLGQGGSLRVQGITLEKPQESPNFYLFCATHEFDRKAMLDFGYDCCVVIEKPERFFAAITHTIRNKTIFQGVHKCQYVPRRRSHGADNGIHPAIIKDPTYRDQKEVRALWQPLKANAQPFIIQCRDAAKYCTLHVGK